MMMMMMKMVKMNWLIVIGFIIIISGSGGGVFVVHDDAAIPLLARGQQQQQQQQQFPCLFIFGDSLVDNGNNNNLITDAKVNYLPYGIDFPIGPTGRFTNGRNLADFIASLLGFQSPIPPYYYYYYSYASSAQDQDILRGLNYASGSAGIRPESGHHMGDRVFLDKQLANHITTIGAITRLLGNDTGAASRHLTKCLYYFNIGSNDYINNYFLPQYYNTSSLYNPNQYASALIQHFSHQLEALYKLGSRKVAVSAIHALGCIPAMISRSPYGSSCNQSMNSAADLFNNKLSLLVRKLNKKYADAKYIVIGTPSVDPPAGVTEPCCKVSNKTGLCIPGETPCGARDLYLFFDNFHPTEIANRLLAASAYTDISTGFLI